MNGPLQLTLFQEKCVLVAQVTGKGRWLLSSCIKKKQKQYHKGKGPSFSSGQAYVLTSVQVFLFVMCFDPFTFILIQQAHQHDGIYPRCYSFLGMSLYNLRH